MERVKALVIPTNAVFSGVQPLDLLWLDETPGGFGAPAQPMHTVIHDLVGGLFEVVRAPDGAFMYLNQEAKSLQLAENLVATALARVANSISMSDFIAGQVVAVGPPSRDGDETDVPEALLRTVEHAGCVIRDSTGTRRS